MRNVEFDFIHFRLIFGVFLKQFTATLFKIAYCKAASLFVLSVLNFLATKIWDFYPNCRKNDNWNDLVFRYFGEKLRYTFIDNLYSFFQKSLLDNMFKW